MFNTSDLSDPSIIYIEPNMVEYHNIPLFAKCLIFGLVVNLDIPFDINPYINMLYILLLL